ncbi:MAG: hypothetical protein HC844_16670, partial [Tabrizicola sp.]|nr:hypothetical protein [Tabrizicola sp.]
AEPGSDAPEVPLKGRQIQRVVDITGGHHAAPRHPLIAPGRAVSPEIAGGVGEGSATTATSASKVAVGGLAMQAESARAMAVSGRAGERNMVVSKNV